MHSPFLLVSDGSGNMFEVPELLAAGMEGMTLRLFEPEDLIKLPFGSDLFMLPRRVPVGFDPEEGDFVLLPEYRGEPVYPVAAFMAPAHMQYYLPAYREPQDQPSSPLPLYGYTAAAWRDDGIWAAGCRVDPDIRQDLGYVDFEKIEKRAPEVLSRFPGNRLVEHLVENCALCYGCPAARNFVLGRWECPVPVSRVCNAGCIGCISYQEDPSGISPAQERIVFTPGVDEIVEFTVPHLEQAENPVISFGQGCEGEPLLEAGLIAEAVKEIRRRTDRGTININTNGSLPDKVELLCRAGIDSIRVSMNSARPELYNRYYRPRNYSFEDVVDSIHIASKHGKWTSLNYFIFPGVTDHPDEFSALSALIRRTGLSMIQTRNTNIDPLLYWRTVGYKGEDLEGDSYIGMRNWIDRIREEFPFVRIGYFNPQVR